MRFRFQALQRMREPDELDSPTLLATPRGWIAVFVVMIVMAGGLVWAFAAELRISAAAPGGLTHPAGTPRPHSHYSGTARPRRGRAGRAGGLIGGRAGAGRQGADGKPGEVASPFTGQVVGTTIND